MEGRKEERNLRSVERKKTTKEGMKERRIKEEIKNKKQLRQLPAILLKFPKDLPLSFSEFFL